MVIRSSSSSGIPYGGTSGRPANPVNGQPYFNGDIGRLELYTSSTGWQNIVQETPGVASATGHYYQSDNYGTFIVSGTNFVSGAIAYAVGTNGVEYQAQTTTYNSLVQLSVTFANLSAEHEPYDIKVTNPSNLFGLLPDAFYINESPIWSTPSGSLGSYAGGSVSIQLESTDAESDSRTYTLVSGSLPTGLSLSTSGLISGTNNAAVGTYNFTISISDGINTAVNRSFSITSTGPTITGGTLSSDTNYYYRTFTSNGNFVVTGASISADVLMIAGGGGGGSGDGGGGSGGGGAGGVYYSSGNTLSSGTRSVVIGSGGNGGIFGGNGSQAGTNSQFGSFTQAVGGGYGNSSSTPGTTPGGDGGSGGGGSGNSAQVGGNGGAATSGQGNVGGNGGNTGSSGGAGYKGGGGGGAGARGQHYSEASTYVSCAGGAGTNTYSSWITGISSAMIGVSGWSTATSTGYIAGGGSGSGIWSGWQYQISGAAGGSGGGGAGGTVGNSQGSVQNGFNGTSNTGGGGGAATYQAAYGGNGGSGIVVVRYAKSQFA